jgi:hypothetical protein
MKTESKIGLSTFCKTFGRHTANHWWSRPAIGAPNIQLSGSRFDRVRTILASLLTWRYHTAMRSGSFRSQQGTRISQVWGSSKKALGDLYIWISSRIRSISHDQTSGVIKSILRGLLILLVIVSLPQLVMMVILFVAHEEMR